VVDVYLQEFHVRISMFPADSFHIILVIMMQGQNELLSVITVTIKLPLQLQTMHTNSKIEIMQVKVSIHRDLTEMWDICDVVIVS